MTHTLIPISKNHKSETTSNVYSVLNRTKCLSCHNVWSLPHSAEGAPGDFLRTPPAITAAYRRRGEELQMPCADCHVITHRLRRVTWRAQHCLPSVNLGNVFSMTGKDWVFINFAWSLGQTLYTFNYCCCFRSLTLGCESKRSDQYLFWSRNVSLLAANFC